MEVMSLTMEIVCGIYKIENKINHKIYIGQSTDIYTRWYNHKYSLQNGIHYNLHLQNAWNKYGADNFEFDIVRECDRINLDDLESAYISTYKSYDDKFGYNLTFGGGGCSPNSETREKLSLVNRGENNPMFGKCHTDKTKKKISEALSGKNNPMFGKRSVNYGKRLSDEHKHKISIAGSGRRLSEVARMNQSQAKAGKNNPRAISVYCIELDEVFDCIKDACDKYGISNDGIGRCVAGKQQSAGRHPLTGEKLHWVYSEQCEVISL